MKIDYVSDLHANHWVLWTKNQRKWEKHTRLFTQRIIQKGHGEVLVLAGDFSEWNIQTLWILDEASKHYERVYYTFGNHDLFLLTKQQRRKYGDSLGRLQELVNESMKIPNVVPLVKNIDIYKGKVFAGDAMWYLPKTQEDWAFYRNVSNDSSDILINGQTIDDIPRQLWKESMDWYDTLEEENIDVFVSHTPPVHPPTSPYPPNGCYQTDVSFLPTNHWICGHNHLKATFQKAGVNFYMNCIGYGDEYKDYQINTIPTSTIDVDVKTFEI
ncbi:metallophosphoesterase [Priestia filamentosa]|uniref:metallophosphoesterase family protein n=1 Tax=Priestia filamentosa TaxID=1402861 RepID=UPI003982626F